LIPEITYRGNQLRFLFGQRRIFVRESKKPVL
jgi:hypothetical protein